MEGDRQQAEISGKELATRQEAAHASRALLKALEDLDVASNDSELFPLVPSLQEDVEMAKEKLQQSLTKEEEPGADRILVEIRQGVGGNEAALWAAMLLRMYKRYGELQGLKCEEIMLMPGAEDGLREGIIAFTGEGAERSFRFEGGIHRVQRVSPTDKRSRIHTSAATVAILVEPAPAQLQIEDRDLRWDSFLSGGNGGQHAQKSQTAVRLTHLPTKITVSMQDERSLKQNQERAMRILRARLLAIAQKERSEGIDNDRRKQVGSGSRAEKTRTYNFPSSRVTDHRIGESFYSLESILDGHLEILQDRLSLI
jgi:peptide chain release factor 1